MRVSGEQRRARSHFLHASLQNRFNYTYEALFNREPMNAVDAPVGVSRFEMAWNRSGRLPFFVLSAGVCFACSHETQKAGTRIPQEIVLTSR
jgi:hypothetical protein